MSDTTTTELLVRQDDVTTTRLRHGAAAPLAEGSVRVRVERFALTANNITYAAFGEAMNYWSFYPTGEAGWGLVPVWGFGTVVESRHAEVPAGLRLYGYWPMASHAVLQPVRVGAEGFMDGAAHRAALNPVYNTLLRCDADPFYTPDTEDLQALLRPLFLTSWLIDDFLADNAFFGADTLLLSSASSKTAYGTAFQLATRAGLKVVGLTSASNRGFCEALGCYQQVLAYDELEALAADTSMVYVDFAGNAALRQAVHTRFANLRFSSAIGGTHLSALGGARALPGPRATLFFAPAQVQKRSREWGAAGLRERMLAGWRAFTERVARPADPWMTVEQHRGEAAVQQAYAEMAAGRVQPRAGHMLSMQG
ncbi:MAG: DUF2855 family protein [Burkholderiales bacterium]|nr:DUF2855 family protein [Burkholderiales bacterium]